jgi:hypothetical protein
MFHSWFLCTSLEFTDLNVQEYLTRFYLPMQPTPNPGIADRTVAENFSASIRDDVACEGSLNQYRLSSVTPDSDYAPHTEPTMPGSVGFSPASSIRDEIFSNDAHHTHPLKWHLTSQYHRPFIVSPCHFLFNVEKKEDYKAGLTDPREMWQRRLNNPLSCVKI